MKAFKLFLISSITLLALQSAIEVALKYYQENTLANHPNALEQLILEANSGNNSAAFLLATAYKNGKLGNVNVDRAYYWYEVCASNDDADAMLMLGWLNYKGTPKYGIRLNAAKKWFQKASRAGVVEASEMLELLR